MQPLTKVSHEHHDRLWGYVHELDRLADCFDCDCLDIWPLTEQMPRLRALHDGLVTQLIPHMEAVEAAVYPTLDRLLPGRADEAPMIAEHKEIRRLVAVLGEYVDGRSEHADWATVIMFRRVALRLHALLKAHLSEEEIYIPILEDQLTPGAQAAIARAIDHLASERL
jgi:hypothetical protein